MIEKEIQELSSLYKEMTNRFRAIKRDGVEEEIQVEHVVIKDIEAYLMELLHVLPKSITIYYNDRLSIHLWKNTYYNNADGDTFQTDAIIVDDNVNESVMIFDKQLESMKFCGMDNLSTSMNLSTLEFMCAEWKNIKQEVYANVVSELDERIRHRLEQINNKKQKLQNFKDWKV